MIQLPIERLLDLLVKEVYLHRRFVVVLFVLISISIVSIGMIWPKSYSAYTTIFVERKNIIQPLMEGAAVATEVTDRARIVKEIVYSRKILTRMLAGTEQLDEEPTDVEMEELIERIKKKIKISNVGKNLIKIEYTDKDPKVSFASVEKLAQLFISESLNAQAKESKQAFDFIDQQVNEYHAKLRSAEEQLKIFRSDNLDARPGTAAQVGTRLSSLQARIEAASQELSEAKITKRSIEKQLSGEEEVTGTMTREGQYTTRILELQAQLDTLRLDYHEGYPDIVRLKHQIEDLRKSIASEQKARVSGKKIKPGTGQYSKQNSFLNPVYQTLRQDLSKTKTLIDTLEARIRENKRLMELEISRGKRVHTGEAKLAELTRDYEVNRDIYRDLLRRREKARVSMNMDISNQGLTLKVYEPPFLPINPSGLRFLHFVIGSLVLGIGVPLAAIFMFVKLDPRVRTDLIISESLRLPVLGTIPHLSSPKEEIAVAVDIRRLSVVLGVTAAIIVIAGLLKIKGVM